MFGKEREGVHSFRLLDVAIVDVVGTMCIAVVLSWLTGLHIGVSIILMFLLGIVSHKVFCVNTKINVALFGKV